jgi:proteasome-associated ATPase
VPRSESCRLFVEETPADTFEEIGGLDGEIAQIQQTIQLHMYRQDIVQKYQARRRSSILLAGPPGNGKTKIARALANWMAGLAKFGRSHFVNIKPGAMNSMWFGQTEANYREAFRAAREASELEKEVPVIVFIDEIDSIGAARGASLMRVDDRVQTAFMAELDGFEGRGNVLVVAATNRRDALDPALLRPGRLGDLVIEIPRPNRKAAAAIFDRYLRRGIPYA